jgi:hypothetical protein
MCEKWVCVDRWWHGELFPHTKHAPHTHHDKALKFLQDRSIDMSPQPSVEATPTPLPTPTPAKMSASATPMPIDLRATQRQNDHKIYDAKLKINFYTKEVARANKDLKKLKKQGSEDGVAMGLVVYNAKVVRAYQMEQLKKVKEEKASLEREKKQLRKQLRKEQHFWE